MSPPRAYRWTGEAMVPLRAPKPEQYVSGGVYWLEEASERSELSHDHQFAWLKQAWLNLPEDIAPFYPTPEHLRKRALIDCGWYDETTIGAGSPKVAKQVAAYVRNADAFALVIVSGPYVFIRKAKSQKRRGTNRMSKADFQASKDAIMEHIAELIGVTPAELGKATAA